MAGGAVTGGVVGAFADAATGDPLAFAVIGGPGELGGATQSYVQQSLTGDGAIDRGKVWQAAEVGGITGRLPAAYRV